MAYASLRAGDEKNREGNDVPLRRDLAAELRQWLDDKLQSLRVLAMRVGEPVPNTLPADTPLFTVPRDLVKILNRDLTAAGIKKVDERGRTLDVHALRHSFGTLLSKGGVAPRTAQAAMRHSTIDLTMNVYTDPKLLDIAGALDELPILPLDGVPATKDANVTTATGTDGLGSRFAPGFAPTSGNGSTSGSIVGNSAHRDVTATSTKKPRETQCFPGFTAERETGFEPATSSLGS